MRRRATDFAQPEAGNAAAGPIDLAHLDRATFGDPALRREVLTLFHRQAMMLAAETADAGTGRERAEAAHKLRGAALGIGAHAVAEAAAALERADGETVQLADLLARLSACVAEARAAVAGLLTRD